MLAATIDRAKGGSYVALKKLLAIFRAACLPSGQDAETGGDDEEERAPSSFTIPTPDIYQQVITGVTENAHACLYALLGLEELTHDRLAQMNKHPRWKKVQVRTWPAWTTPATSIQAH